MNTTIKNNIKIPTHIAFIIDGNGRWAKERNMPRSYGHKVGFNTLIKILKECFNLGIKYVSVYAFSTENWNRPKKEVDYLMNLFRKMLKSNLLNDFPNIKINIMGDYTRFPEDLAKSIEDVMNETKDNDGGIMNLGLNYGGRDEIVYAVNKLLKLGKKEITKEEFASMLYTSSQPDPDFIIRTSGEQRLSNFMPWQSAYAEFYFPKTYWPAFNKKELHNALIEYSKRDRRFGAIKEG
mgnify:CR=1 FL=1